MKKVLSLLVLAALLLCAGTAAYAESGEGVQKGDIVYLGTWQGAPLRWLVLDPDATNADTEGMFLLAEQTLTNQGTIYSWTKAVWQGSDGQAWCAKLLKENFTEAEQAAIPAVSKSEGQLTQYGLNWGAVELVDEKVFYPSVVELGNYIGPNDGDAGLSATYIGNGKTTYYWLRTPHGMHADYAGLVIEENQVHDYQVWGSWGGRPATNLGGEGLLYLAAADRVLSTGDYGPMPSSASGEWKPTVIDSSLSLSVTGVQYADGRVTLQYDNAPMGAWISVLARNSEGENVGYCCLGLAHSAAGELSFTPQAAEGMSFCVFAERDNGLNTTNTASAPVVLSWTAAEPAQTEAQAEAPAETAPETPAETSAETASQTESAQQPAENFWLDFLRETWMFALAFVAVGLLAIVVAIRQAYDRRYY